MPRGDGTGPMGMGSKLGRGAGFCTGFASPGYSNHVRFGGGFGRVHGFRRMSCTKGLPGWMCSGYSPCAENYEPGIGEKELLNHQAELLENQLQQVKKRISRLDDDTQ